MIIKITQEDVEKRKKEKKLRCLLKGVFPENYLITFDTDKNRVYKKGRIVKNEIASFMLLTQRIIGISFTDEENFKELQPFLNKAKIKFKVNIGMDGYY